MTFRHLLPQYLAIVLLVIILSINIYTVFTHPDSFRPLRQQLTSPSPGDNYQGHLKLWYLYAQGNLWDLASAEEKYLNLADFATYKSLNNPDQVARNLYALYAKSDKSLEDWMELARLQLRLNRRAEALNSITQAKNLDPIRDDIDQFYRQLSQ